MTEDDINAYVAWAVEDYAGEISNNFHIPIEEARTNAASQINGLLSEGAATPNQFLYTIALADGDQAIRLGHLWIYVDRQKKRCFIYDIYLHPEYRRQGWGRKALELLEKTMKQQGVESIGLHVFAQNTIAHQLYSQMGYETISVNMQKRLA